jgi:hypothetical protein
MFIASKTTRGRIAFLGAGLGVYALVNLPFLVLNPKLWFAAFDWTYNWYIENSWMLVLTPNIYSPLRHYIPPVTFAIFIIAIIWLRFRKGVDDPIVLAFLSMFGYVFSTYIYPPQMNLALLPFFVLLPVSGYVEFMLFDIANAMIIILGFSEALLPLSISYSFSAFTRFGLLWWIEVIRSFWVGKFTVVNRIPELGSARWKRWRLALRIRRRRKQQLTLLVKS